MKDILSFPSKFIKDEEIKIQNIPFARRVFGEKSEYSDQKEYYDKLTEILTVKEELEAYKNSDYYIDFRNKYKKEISLIFLAKTTESSLRKLRKARNQAEARGNKKRVKELEKSIKDLYIQFSKKFNNVMND
jgi:hypothetical protein